MVSSAPLEASSLMPAGMGPTQACTSTPASRELYHGSAGRPGVPESPKNTLGLSRHKAAASVACHVKRKQNLPPAPTCGQLHGKQTYAHVNGSAALPVTKGSTHDVTFRRTKTDGPDSS